MPTGSVSKEDSTRIAFCLHDVIHYPRSIGIIPFVNS